MALNSLMQGELRLGNLTVRLARDTRDVHLAQKLRYRVFYQEMQAEASAGILAAERDFDDLDDVCDHLLVIDETRIAEDGKLGEVVGTYRLILPEMAARRGRFYSEDEFDIAPLKEYGRRTGRQILEVGRSCVDMAYRNRPTLELLWRGLAAYNAAHSVSMFFGCASFVGTDVAAIAAQLDYLQTAHVAPPELRAVALPTRRVPEHLYAGASTNVKQSFMGLPPLLKGYLRVGAVIGQGAVYDHAFHTIDVCIIVRTEAITDKYLRHYERVTGADLIS